MDASADDHPFLEFSLGATVLHPPGVSGSSAARRRSSDHGPTVIPGLQLGFGDAMGSIGRLSIRNRHRAKYGLNVAYLEIH